jgi:hypothetical protein
MDTPRDRAARAAAQSRELTDAYIARARRAGLHVTTSFQRELGKIVTLGMTRSKGDTAPVQRAADKLVAESIRIAQDAHDADLEPEHLQAAKSSLCPLWPIC